MEDETEGIDWLGILATEEEIKENNLGRSNCIINRWDTLQFYIKVISRMPGQASNTQYVVCYGNRLDNEAIIDNQAYDEDVRINDYVKQLKNYFLFLLLLCVHMICVYVYVWVHTSYSTYVGVKG